MRLLKYCSMCDSEKPFENFKEKGKNWVTFYCNECIGDGYIEVDSERELFMFREITLSRLIELSKLYGVDDLIIETGEDYHPICVYLYKGEE